MAIDERLAFLISAPRSGSTLLARMLGAHSAIHAPVEPHLMPPLAHLGYYATVESAPYDPVITQRGLREFVKGLPGGEEDFLEAQRALTGTLYQRSLEASGRRLFLDKTPAYALVLDFLVRLHPRARYVVLTRHPVAIWSSYVDSFFDGDHEAAHQRNPVLERYVPAIARFLRERPVPLLHVTYEELVQDPPAQLTRICEHLGLAFEPAMVEYGEAGGGAPIAKGLGDPITAAQEGRPTTRSLQRWAKALATEPELLAQVHEIVARLADEDLATFGHPRAEIEAELAAITPSGVAPPRRKLTRYTLERRLLVLLRRNIHHNAFGRLVRRVRTVCDVLLR